MQVLNELANVARRKMQMPWAETRSFLSLLRRLLAVQPLDLAAHEAGWRLPSSFEDLRHDKALGSLPILNPFRTPG